MHGDELAAMIAADEHHWWYRGRRRILRAVIDGLDLPRPARVLDAGCGSGRTLDDLARYGRATGVDLSPVATQATRARGHEVRIARLESLPFRDGRFDLVTCLDVLEHTPDDRRSLAELRRVTVSGGTLVLTVPAHPRLWSAHDEVNEHFRRYTAAALRDAAAPAGWVVSRMTYFNSSLLPAAAAVRALHRRRPGRRSELAMTPPALDGLLELPLRLESAAIRHGARIPVGLSLLAVLVNPRAAPRTSVAPRRRHAVAPVLGMREVVG